MTEYTYTPIQPVEQNQNVLLEASIPCNKGYVIHRNSSGILTIRSINCQCFVRYVVVFNGNIAIPEGGTVEEISVSLAIDGEALQSSRARVTPAAADEYFNVTSTAVITIPKGCCYTVSVQNTSSQGINVQNANVTVTRTV